MEMLWMTRRGVRPRRKSTRERRRLDQRVGMNVDGQVSRMFSGGLHATVRVRPVNEVLHQELM